MTGFVEPMLIAVASATASGVVSNALAPKPPKAPAPPAAPTPETGAADADQAQASLEARRRRSLLRQQQPQQQNQATGGNSLLGG